jgi:hypothetical protein
MRFKTFGTVGTLERNQGPIAVIEVTVTVDFGPVAKPRFEQTVAVPEKSTVLDTLTSLVPVVTLPRYGMEHFVEEIDGISNDFAGDHGWRFEVNGYRSNVPAERYLVKNGDWVKWVYVEGTCS